MRKKPEIDMEAFRELAGYANVTSAVTVFYTLMRVVMRDGGENGGEAASPNKKAMGKKRNGEFML
ncbi:hypothetical protein LTR95_002293 [Oleoguttula sp. CCFEE 5521]